MLQFGTGDRMGAADQGADTGDQLRQAEWFGHIVVRTDIEAGNGVFHAAACRQHQHGQAHFPVTQSLHEGQSIDIRQTDVYHGQIKILFAEMAFSTCGVSCHIHGIARVGQSLFDAACHQRIIFDNQNTHCFPPVSSMVTPDVSGKL